MAHEYVSGKNDRMRFAALRRLPNPRDALSGAAVLGAHLFARRGPLPGRSYVSDEAPIIICGMHRSGTSVVTRLLEQAGMYVGGTWLDANHESFHFLRANRAMLGEGYYLLHDFGWTAPKNDDFIRTRRGYAERAACRNGAFFVERAGQSTWGWKDPRNCLTLAVWLSIYPNARVLHVVRDGRAAALSLADRDGLDPSFGLALWATYLTRLNLTLEEYAETPQLTVRYEDLLEAPGSVLAEMLDFAGLESAVDLATLASVLERGRTAARASDIRFRRLGLHPLLAAYGYCSAAEAFARWQPTLGGSPEQSAA